MRGQLICVLLLSLFASVYLPAESRLLKSVGGKGSHRFYPVCLFVERGAGDMPAIAKSLVEEAGKKCGVRIDLFTVYVNNVPGDPSEVSALARQRCKAIESGRRLGVDRASSIVVTKSSSTARLKCNPDAADTHACAEYARHPGETIESTMQQTGNWGGVAPQYKPAVSIVSGSRPDTLKNVHAMGLGVSMMGKPLGGDDSGMGVGGIGAFGGSGLGSFGWKPAGCESMRAAAFSLPGEFDPSRSYNLKDGGKTMDFVTGEIGGGAPAVAGGGAGAGSAPAGVGGAAQQPLDSSARPAAANSANALGEASTRGGVVQPVGSKIEGHQIKARRRAPGSVAQPKGLGAATRTQIDPGSKLGFQDGNESKQGSANASSGRGGTSPPLAGSGSGGNASSGGGITGMGPILRAPGAEPESQLDADFFEPKKSEDGSR